MTRSHSSLKSPAKARTQFEDFGFTKLEVFALPERGGVFEAYSFTKPRALCLAQAEKIF